MGPKSAFSLGGRVVTDQPCSALRLYVSTSPSCASSRPVQPPSRHREPSSSSSASLGSSRPSSSRRRSCQPTCRAICRQRRDLGAVCSLVSTASLPECAYLIPSCTRPALRNAAQIMIKKDTTSIPPLAPPTPLQQDIAPIPSTTSKSLPNTRTSTLDERTATTNTSLRTNGSIMLEALKRSSSAPHLLRCQSLKLELAHAGSHTPILLDRGATSLAMTYMPPTSLEPKLSSYSSFSVGALMSKPRPLLATRSSSTSRRMTSITSDLATDLPLARQQAVELHQEERLERKYTEVEERAGVQSCSGFLLARKTETSTTSLHSFMIPRSSK